jgi:hypothetical protein
VKIEKKKKMEADLDYIINFLNNAEFKKKFSSSKQAPSSGVQSSIAPILPS